MYRIDEIVQVFKKFLRMPQGSKIEIVEVDGMRGIKISKGSRDGWQESEFYPIRRIKSNGR